MKTIQTDYALMHFLGGRNITVGIIKEDYKNKEEAFKGYRKLMAENSAVPFSRAYLNELLSPRVNIDNFLQRDGFPLPHNCGKLVIVKMDFAVKRRKLTLTTYTEGDKRECDRWDINDFIEGYDSKRAINITWNVEECGEDACYYYIIESIKYKVENE